MRNEHSDFVGIERLNTEHSAGLKDFRRWATNRDWQAFHNNHYDWWMFPYDQPSQMGFAYTVYETEVHQLLALEGFRARHIEGAHLLLLSWGWDVETNSRLLNPDPIQKWSNWPIRLFKCAKSMEQFGHSEEFQSCLAFTKILHSEGASFTWSGGRNLLHEFGITG